MKADELTRQAFSRINNEKIENRDRGIKIRESVRASPVVMAIVNGLKELTKLSDNRLGFAIKVAKEYESEPDVQSTIARIESNLKVSGSVTKVPLFGEPFSAGNISTLIAVEFTADGGITSGRLSEFDMEDWPELPLFLRGQPIYPKPGNQSQKQQAEFDRINIVAVAAVLEYFKDWAIRGKLLPPDVTIPKAMIPKPVLVKPKIDPVSGLRDTLKSPKANWLKNLLHLD